MSNWLYLKDDIAVLNCFKNCYKLYTTNAKFMIVNSNNYALFSK